jgi:hypothetical protein
LQAEDRADYPSSRPEEIEVIQMMMGGQWIHNEAGFMAMAHAL